MDPGSAPLRGSSGTTARLVLRTELRSAAPAIPPARTKKARGAGRGLDRFELREPQAATTSALFFSHSSPQIITAWPGETSRYWRTGGT